MSAIDVTCTEDHRSRSNSCKITLFPSLKPSGVGADFWFDFSSNPSGCGDIPCCSGAGEKCPNTLDTNLQMSKAVNRILLTQECMWGNQHSQTWSCIRSMYTPTTVAPSVLAWEISLMRVDKSGLGRRGHESRDYYGETDALTDA
jgi:hypothetical protein